MDIVVAIAGECKENKNRKRTVLLFGFSYYHCYHHFEYTAGRRGGGNYMYFILLLEVGR